MYVRVNAGVNVSHCTYVRNRRVPHSPHTINDVSAPNRDMHPFRGPRRETRANARRATSESHKSRKIRDRSI